MLIIETFKFNKQELSIIISQKSRLVTLLPLGQKDVQGFILKLLGTLSTGERLTIALGIQKNYKGT